MRRISGIEGARGVAALMVFGYHIWLYALSTPGKPFGRQVPDLLLGHLWVGLTFFFVLSGFVLYRPFAAAGLGATQPPRLGRYLAARAARILPAYWFALLFAAPMVGWHLTRGQTLANFAFLQTTLPHEVVAIGPSWTLCIEATFYLVLPMVAAAAALVARGSAVRLVSPLLLLVALGVVDRGGLTLHGWERLPETIDLFAVGMIAAVAVEAGWTRRWVPLVAVPLVLAALPFAHSSPGRVAADPRSAALFDTLIACAFGCVVIGIVNRASPLRFFSWRPLVALGTISYGFYLWHQTLILYFVWRVPETARLSVTERTALIFTASLLAGALSWFAIERPMLRLRRAERRRSHAAAVPVAD